MSKVTQLENGYLILADSKASIVNYSLCIPYLKWFVNKSTSDFRDY